MRISRAEAKSLGIDVPAAKKDRKAKIEADDKARQAIFLALCDAHDLPRPEPEYQFARPRLWRFDYAWPIRLISLEIQGGIWTGGRHVRGAALKDEHEKLNEAAIRSWRILYCMPAEVKDGSIFAVIRRAMAGD